MKKTLLLLASAALLLVGCAKEQIGVGQIEGGLVNATFTANLDSGVATKALADGDGAAANVNRCIMEIYYGDELFTRQYAPVNEQKKATFTAQVVSNRTYTVAFWADKVDATTEAGLAIDKYYTTTSLKNITLKGSYVGNDDARDAFFHNGTYKVEQAGSSWGDIKLYRPFAQMNVITTDWDLVTTALAPQNVNVTLKNALVAFNAVTGEASGSQTLEYEAAVYSAPAPTSAALANEKTLSMDYLFASTTKALIDIDWKAIHGTDTDVEHAFAAVPYQRNYRTNIKGKLLTTQGQWTVMVDVDWSGDGTTVEGGEDPYLVNYFATGSIAAANEALKTNNAVSIDNPSDFGTDIVIPTEQDGENVLIKITGASAGDIVIKNENDGAANLKLESDSKNLTVNTPKTHVDLNKGDFVGVTATTSATTLVVGKDVEIETLTINGGNAEIYGLVNTISRAGGVKANWYADNRAKLIAGLDNSVAGESVTLTADIDLNNEEWAPVTIGKAIVFDGANHTISNLKIAGEYSDSHYGLIGYLYSSGVIKNLTIDGAQILPPASKGDNSRGAALVGIARSGDIINCHVKNVTVSAYQKVGGLIGQYSLEGSGTSLVKDCSAENVSISENQTGEGVWGAGGLIGSLCLVNNNHNITIEGCSVKDITIANSTTEAAPKQTAHAFIGTIRDDAEAVVSLTNNTVEQATGLYTDMYSSEYFGWATNNESNPSFKCQIIIDGQAWAPNYPIKNVTKGISYATLAKAVADASAEDVIKITEAGTYTVPGISKNITVAGAAEGDVVFNCEGSGSIASIPNGATFKNVTMNFGQSGYHGFQGAGHIIMEECILNGMFFSYGDMTFNDCEFNQTAEDYNMWTYGGNVTYDGCAFNSKGKFLNVYRESAVEYNVVAKNCVFNTSKANKAALNIKETCGAIFLKYNVTIENCSCNELQNSLENKDDGTLYRVSPIWQIDDRKAGETAINVTVDGLKVYPFCSKDADGNYHIVNAAGLLQFHDLYAAGKVAHTAEVYIENDIDFTGKTWTACEWHADGNKKGFALFDGQNHTIKNFTVSGQGMFSRWACSSTIGATPYFKNIVFDGAKNVTSSLNVSLFCGQTYQNAKIENVTIKNSQIEGTYKVAPFVGSVYDENGTGPTLTLKDCKVEDTTVRGTSYDFDVCGMVAWVNEDNNDKIAFEGNNVVKNVTLYAPSEFYNMCAKIYHNGETAYNEAANVTVDNVNVVIGQ